MTANFSLLMNKETRYTTVTNVYKNMKLNSNMKPKTVCSIYLENLYINRGQRQDERVKITKEIFTCTEVSQKSIHFFLPKK